MEQRDRDGSIVLQQYGENEKQIDRATERRSDGWTGKQRNRKRERWKNVRTETLRGGAIEIQRDKSTDD